MNCENLPSTFKEYMNVNFELNEEQLGIMELNEFVLREITLFNCYYIVATCLFISNDEILRHQDPG